MIAMMTTTIMILLCFIGVFSPVFVVVECGWTYRWQTLLVQALLRCCFNIKLFQICQSNAWNSQPGNMHPRWMEHCRLQKTA